VPEKGIEPGIGSRGRYLPERGARSKIRFYRNQEGTQRGLGRRNTHAWDKRGKDQKEEGINCAFHRSNDLEIKTLKKEEVAGEVILSS